MSDLKHKEFLFKEEDEEGWSTLEAIAGAPRFNEWMYRTTSKNLSGRILEIGSGIGNISEYYLADKRDLVLSDIRDNYCDYLKQKFGDHPNCKAVVKIDLVHPNFEEEYKDLLKTFDGLFALNVVEHIKEDTQALVNAKKLLRKGGRMVILVPAYQFLYNQFDKALDHYRRYSKSHLKKVFVDADVNIVRSQYFNFAGIFGWYVSGQILKKKIIPQGQMKLYNSLVPIFKIADKVILNQIGLSVIVEGDC